MRASARVTVATAAMMLLSLLAIGACHSGAPKRPAAAPPAAVTRHAIVVAANPLAAQTGMKILQAGGSAADAAVAMQAVLGLVEPQSSGLGGGAFITYYDAKKRRVLAYSGRETAPAGATADMFIGPDHHPLPFATAVLSGRATGVPGAIAALALLQHEHGKLAWKKLFDDGERLASEGFRVSPRLAGMIASGAPEASAPDVARYFTKGDGTRYRSGDVLVNPAYAATLQRLAEHGPHALYRGPIAQDIVARVHQGELPGTLSLQDLKNYRPIESEALCRDWQRYRVCGPPPPAGAVGVIETLELLAHTDIGTRSAEDPQAWVELSEAQRLMYADRDRYIADPAFVNVPLAGLLDPAYLQSRATLIGRQIAAQPPLPGNPPGAAAFGPDHTAEPGGTSHVVIVDDAGDVLSMTTTVESIFGSGRMVDGFLLNNQLTDFSFSPQDPDGRAAANAVAPGKRPRSAMSPMIVFDRDGHFVAAAGSAGGPAIIAYVVKTLIGTLDWHMTMQSAISLPNLVAHGEHFSAETAHFPPEVLSGMNRLGLNPQPVQYEESGIQGVLAHADGTYEGGADPRREGVALSY
ncbi:MAG TPA: gamma-glutamyltransferase family protein [Steroidobacteraceae bacterium]|jgi:gamma-glutamyltranspeptidase/glutathione hydrolase